MKKKQYILHTIVEFSKRDSEHYYDVVACSSLEECLTVADTLAHEQTDLINACGFDIKSCKVLIDRVATVDKVCIVNIE